MEKETFEEKIERTGVIEFNCLLEIARQTKRIADVLEMRMTR